MAWVSLVSLSFHFSFFTEPPSIIGSALVPSSSAEGDQSVFRVKGWVIPRTLLAWYWPYYGIVPNGWQTEESGLS